MLTRRLHKTVPPMVPDGVTRRAWRVPLGAPPDHFDGNARVQAHGRIREVRDLSLLFVREDEDLEPRSDITHHIGGFLGRPLALP